MNEPLTHIFRIYIGIDCATKVGLIGPSILILPVSTKNGKASPQLTKALETVNLKIGWNDYDPNGLLITVSKNGWEQKYNLKEHVEALIKFKEQLLLTDGWSLFKYEEFVNPLLNNCVYPCMLFLQNEKLKQTLFKHIKLLVSQVFALQR